MADKRLTQINHTKASCGGSLHILPAATDFPFYLSPPVCIGPTTGVYILSRVGRKHVDGEKLGGRGVPEQEEIG